WPQVGYPVRKEFRAVLKNSYGVSIQPVDYRNADEAREQINTWVAEKTAGKIKDFAEPGLLNADTKLVLTNAIYFKGRWAVEFDRNRTVTMPFRMKDRHSVNVPMMTQTTTAPYVDLGDLTIVELTYSGPLSMVLALPKELDGITKSERELTADTIGDWSRTAVRRRVCITMPKFRIQSKFALRHSLVALGMKEAFDSRKSDLSRMSGGESQLFLSDVIQNAFVEVSEQGTEAGVSSASVVRKRSALSPVVNFLADHPFLFWILDRNTGTVCFLGRLVTPK